MKYRSTLSALALTVAGFFPLSVVAQQKTEAELGVHVQARGPVHEAFAQPFEAVASSETVVKLKPPEPINEEPPGQRPEGANMRWIPGYWNWDADRKDYMWVTGAWRAIPEGRRWVVG